MNNPSGEKAKQHGIQISKKQRLLFPFFILLITYLFIEVACWICIYTGYIPAQKPSFHYQTRFQYTVPVADIHPVWRTWHYSNDHFTNNRGCLFLDYVTNSYGARDIERSRKSRDSNRVVVLGDSFMEGYGLKVEERLSILHEKRTQQAFMNFACSDFGPTQSYLLYTHLAKQFDHSTIVMGFLPFNDFDDDDTLLYEIHKRYKPYFIRRDTGYQLEYHNVPIEQSIWNRDVQAESFNTLKNRIARFLRAFTWWFNIVDYIRQQKRLQPATAKAGKPENFYYYYDYTPAQLDKLQFVLRKLRTTAHHKRVVLICIPHLSDYIRFTKTGEPPLPGALKKISTELNIEFIDLLPLLLSEESNYRKLYFSCDLHWNKRANEMAARFLEPYFVTQKNNKEKFTSE